MRNHDRTFHPNEGGEVLISNGMALCWMRWEPKL